MTLARHDGSAPVLRGDYPAFGEALLAAGQQFGEHTAFVEGSQRLSYAQWARAADGLAADLKARGIEVGDVIAIFLPSSIDYAVCVAAIQMLGAIATGINLRLGTREIGAILSKTKPKLVITEDQYVLPELNPRPSVLSRGELPTSYARKGLGRDRPDLRPDSLACIVWTSGTTGLPKGACFDHANLKAAVDTAGVMCAPFDRCVIPVPFAHAGYMGKPWQLVAFGITYVLMPGVWTAKEMLRLMVAERITVGMAVPTQWSKLLELPELTGSDLSSLRLCMASTAPVPPELAVAVTRAFGCPLIVRYAMTESPSITGTTVGDSPDVLYKTVGRPQNGLELIITDEKGMPLKDGQVGRIRLCGDTVMRGYWNDPEETSKALTPDGWLISSDLGYLDKDGNLVLSGRVSDMYIRGGYNVYPLEAETVLAEHPGVRLASIVGIPTPVIGEIGVAYIVPVDLQAPPSETELREWCLARIADYKAPDAFQFVAELPLTSMMKIDKNALRVSASQC